MTDRETIEALIQRSYEARRTGDIEGILAIFHPDCKFELAGSKEHSAAVGTAHGHRELRNVLEGLIAAFQFVQRDMVSVIIDGERAVAHSRATVRFVPKDRTATTELLDLWRFDDGKAVEFVEFLDTALVNDLMR